MQVVHDPPLQTMLAPQGVPGSTLVPVSVHTGAPDPQAICPTWQVLAGVQEVPCVHAPQGPLSQTKFVPHDAPFPRLPPVSMHVGVPVEHLSDPVWHGLAGGHEAPCMQALHAPFRHTSLVPHDVPLVTSAPVSLHTGAPVEQSIAPTWQLFDGVHPAPAVHALHAPAWQTMLVPHPAPFAAFVPVSPQVGGLVEQLSVPVWQGLAAGVHAPPVVHALHTPVSHTMPVPHVLPLDRLTPVSVHSGTPVEQSVAPAWQTFVGVQAAPVAHATHAPLRQTSFVPHDVPFVALWPVSLHDGAVPEQSMVPVWHRSVGMHAAPASQGMGASPSEASLPSWPAIESPPSSGIAPSPVKASPADASLSGCPLSMPSRDPHPAAAQNQVRRKAATSARRKGARAIISDGITHT